MEHFEKLGSWGELYVMRGTSSAALIGLLFVSASLHLREIVSDDIYKIRAQDTTLLLVATLVQAAFILTPQPIHILGIALDSDQSSSQGRQDQKAEQARWLFRLSRDVFHFGLFSRHRRVHRSGFPRGLGSLSGNGLLR
jgi:hypothetical protein